MIEKKNLLDYDKSKVVDVEYRMVSETYTPVDLEKRKKKVKFLKIVVFIGAILSAVAFSFWYQISHIKDIAWRLGCTDGGLTPQQCVDVQKLEKAK